MFQLKRETWRSEEGLQKNERLMARTKMNHQFCVFFLVKNSETRYRTEAGDERLSLDKLVFEKYFGGYGAVTST